MRCEIFRWKMILAVAFALAYSCGASLVPNATEEPIVEHWKYDQQTRRQVLREQLSKVLAKDGEEPCTATNWSLENFIERYLENPQPHSQYTPPDNKTIENLIENNDQALFHPYIFEDYLKKYKIDEDKHLGMKPDKKFEGWTFTDFAEKYEATKVWERVRDEALIVGRNDTHDVKFFSLTEGLDSTDELLGLKVPRSGRRFWNNQWQDPQLPHNGSLRNGDLETVLYFMRQAIYFSRDRMKAMQQLRDEYRERAVYKMGYLFGKTDFACKIFSSLAFKAFRDCSVTRMRVFGQNRVFKFYLDTVYNIERLLGRWFDVDIMKDLLISNDMIARKVLLKDENLTTPEMVVEAFDQMFIE
ncbi:uncharacterized protein LOC125232119 [Leguminivora glycinivorella]|uniref:uncharacterized protein LOC125232119 n=1 Tax=Leguminivora glycinivorella TaxID=1035111 RepID=UPI00200F0BB9|nr:uncharacterized protein LOC125232119 [Leguminivora glycinivorella]